MNSNKRIAISLAFCFISIFCFSSFVYSINKTKNNNSQPSKNRINAQIIKADKERIIRLADEFIKEKPITVTATSCPRSAGGVHDFYSEATYWWPNPANPNGPYIRKDGVNNPENFDTHRQALGQFSWILGTETSAYLITGNNKYADAAVGHLKAWFVDTTTLMNPQLLYAQAIKGVNTGRGIGIIDAAPLIEVTKAVEILAKNNRISAKDYSTIKAWFSSFLIWLCTHPNGIEEMNQKNNHGTWWHAQAAAYARFVGDEVTLDKCRKKFSDLILPTQMAQNGGYPLELERTKPYSYSLFNLDGMSALAILVSNKDFDGWNYLLSDGRGMKKGVDFIKPYLLDISKWTYKKDIAHWDELPGRHPFMCFAASSQNDLEWVEIWKKNNSEFPSDESKRNLPLKNPILWLDIASPIK
ncbi:MAG: alginate lyase family protein [Bacteroidales bacterium]